MVNGPSGPITANVMGHVAQMWAQRIEAGLVPIHLKAERVARVPKQTQQIKPWHAPNASMVVGPPGVNGPPAPPLVMDTQGPSATQSEPAPIRLRWGEAKNAKAKTLKWKPVAMNCVRFTWLARITIRLPTLPMCSTLELTLAMKRFIRLGQGLKVTRLKCGPKLISGLKCPFSEPESEITITCLTMTGELFVVTYWAVLYDFMCIICFQVNTRFSPGILIGWGNMEPHY